MQSYTSVSFVRHGNVRNNSDIYYGRLLGFPLSELGRDQARATMEFLRERPIAYVYSSPRLRARETAQIIASGMDSMLSISELLDEAYTPFDGRPKSELRKRNWDVYSGTDARFEQPKDVLDRALQFLSEVRLGHREQQIVAITHGDIIAFLMLWSRGRPCTPRHKQVLYDEKYLAEGSICTFIFHPMQEDELTRVEYVDPSERGEVVVFYP